MHVELLVEFESDEFVGNESSQSVQIAITKSNAPPNTIITVQITFSEHPSMPATGKRISSMHTYVHIPSYF